MDSCLGGVHFELTCENVMECIGGARGLSSGDLKKAYKSHVDPRLNYEQSLEMAHLIGREMAQKSFIKPGQNSIALFLNLPCAVKLRKKRGINNPHFNPDFVRQKFSIIGGAASGMAKIIGRD